MAPSLKPFQQGHLDGLCGIYATINAIRLALRGYPVRYADGDWRELFSALLAEVDDLVGAAEVVSYGIDTRPLLKVARSAASQVSADHDGEIRVRRVFGRKDRPEMPDVLDRLAGLVEAENSAVILSLTGHYGHWTVLRAVRRTSLELFDSNGIARVRIAHCRTPRESGCLSGAST